MQILYLKISESVLKLKFREFWDLFNNKTKAFGDNKLTCRSFQLSLWLIAIFRIHLLSNLKKIRHQHNKNALIVEEKLKDNKFVANQSR